MPWKINPSTIYCGLYRIPLIKKVQLPERLQKAAKEGSLLQKIKKNDPITVKNNAY